MTMATPRGRILLVGKTVSKPREQLLVKAGFDVVAELLAGKPVRSLRTGKFDLVVTELSTGGLDFLQEARRGGASLPAVAVAAKPKADLVAKAGTLSALVCRPNSLRHTVKGVHFEVKGVHFERDQSGRHNALKFFRNRRGDQIDIASVTATDAKNEFSRVLEIAMEGGAVAITRHETPKAVLISMDEFHSLVAARDGDLNALSSEFDVLLSKMQTPATRKGMQSAFDATPAEMGQAALMAASKSG
jgi:antitoxin Phd